MSLLIFPQLHYITRRKKKSELLNSYTWKKRSLDSGLRIEYDSFSKSLSMLAYDI